MSFKKRNIKQQHSDRKKQNKIKIKTLANHEKHKVAQIIYEISNKSQLVVNHIKFVNNFVCR